MANFTLFVTEEQAELLRQMVIGQMEDTLQEGMLLDLLKKLEPPKRAGDERPQRRFLVGCSRVVCHRQIATTVVWARDDDEAFEKAEEVSERLAWETDGSEGEIDEDRTDFEILEDEALSWSYDEATMVSSILVDASQPAEQP